MPASVSHSSPAVAKILAIVLDQVERVDDHGMCHPARQFVKPRRARIPTQLAFW
jgi:hypothetical protein